MNPEYTTLEKVAARVGKLAAAQDALKQAVRHARSDGHTWQEIGEALGVSRQAAWERYGYEPIEPPPAIKP